MIILLVMTIFSIDFYLRQTWQDPRLAFGKFDLGLRKIEALTVSESLALT